MIRVLSLFSGIGGFERALQQLNIPHEIVNYCEIDKYAAKAYSLLHNINEEKNLKDITKIDFNNLPNNIDILTYGFPCQDISLAGKRTGLVDTNNIKTKSGLVWDAHKIIEKVNPKVAICENVKNLVGKKFKNEFNSILRNLENIGYKNYYKVLNAKDFNVPQNRERVFIISIRNDIDFDFNFPKPITLSKDLASILDIEVDEKYLISERLCNYFNQHSKEMQEKGNGFRFEPTYDCKNIAHTVLTKSGCRMDDNFIKLREITSNMPDGFRVYESANGLSRTLKALGGGCGAKTGLYKVKSNIRKLTPSECFKLMGFNSNDVKLLQENKISDTQLYKMAGNSIVVDVLMAIFKQLDFLYPK